MTRDTSEFPCDSSVDIFYNVEVRREEYIKEPLMNLEMRSISKLYTIVGTKYILQMEWKPVHSSGDIGFVPQVHCNPALHQEDY